MELSTMEIVDLSTLSIHPEAEKVASMTAERFEAFKLDIETNGQLDPVILYRNRIVDGRNRHRALTMLNITTIKVMRMNNNSTIEQIRSLVQSKENRRHETVSQIAITAYKYMNSTTGTNISRAEAGEKFGVNVKRISEVKSIAETYGRADIIEILFNGEKFDTGEANIPFWTDSLGTIIRWLTANGTVRGSGNVKPKVSKRTELTEDEQVIANEFLNAINAENEMIRSEIVRSLYQAIKEGK